MKFREYLNETLTIRDIRQILNGKKDIHYDENWNTVTSPLSLRDLIAKVQRHLKVKLNKEEPQETDSDIYTIGDITILASETRNGSRLAIIEK